MENTQTNTELKLKYLIFGGGIGAILALLFAPKSGYEMRNDIKCAAKKGIAKTEAMAEDVAGRAHEMYDGTMAKADEAYDYAKQKVEDASAAVTTGAHNFHDAIHRDGNKLTAAVSEKLAEFKGE